MIVVKVELWSAVTGRKTEIARMEIANDGQGTKTRGNYLVRTLKGRSTEALAKGVTQRTGEIQNWPRLSKHVWNLVAAALDKLHYSG